MIYKNNKFILFTFVFVFAICVFAIDISKAEAACAWCGRVGPAQAAHLNASARGTVSCGNAARWVRVHGGGGGGGGNGGVGTEGSYGPPPDLCKNLNGHQNPIPKGFKEENDKCVLKTEFYVTCNANPNPVKPGQPLNFLAIPFYHTGDVEFKWYSGASAGGSLLKTQITDGVSFLKSSFPNEGNQQVSFTAVDEAGNRQERSCGVSVRKDADTVADSAKEGYVKDAEVEFILEETYTNSTCTAEWKTKNVAQCFIANAQGTSDALTELNGKKEVNPGTWFLRCLSQQLVDGVAYVIQSDEKVCRSNLDVRER